MNPIAEDILMHYGMPRRSGRYPWGSGDSPYQHNRDFLSRVEEMRKAGFTYTDEDGNTYTGDKAIYKSLGLTSGQFRTEIGIARDQRRMLNVARAQSLKEDGLSTSEIGRKMGVNESTVRSWLNPESKARMEEAMKTASMLKEQVDRKRMVDVGSGVERELGISKEKFNQALYLLEREGYGVYSGGVPQVTNPGQQTTQRVLCIPEIKPKGDAKAPAEIYDYANVHSLEDYYSHDGGQTFDKFVYPKSMDSKRLQIRYAEDGGIEKDGIVELRRGVDDLSLGDARYSQVRILVDDTKYIKGMAVYSDNMPDGVDVIFNTNKSKDVPKMDVLKNIKNDPDNPFGSLIKANGQSYYIDKDGNRQLSLINKRADQGDWDEWSNGLPSQFLSKQPISMAKKQLNLAKIDKLAEYDEICSLTNPTIKKHLLEEFADNCDSAAVSLKAAALPGQKYHVIIPITSLKDNEVYAPGYPEGTQLALIRYPHGGTFEIPRLTVTHKNPTANEVIGRDAIDAVGINHKIAERLSGADFDGDTVMCIPTHDPQGRVRIKSTDPLPGLEGFDPKDKYREREGMTYMKDPKTGKDSTQMQMGIISNLITDMTLDGGATKEELAAAVRHSMVVIDAAKHKLDYKRSEVDNNISALKKKYQRRVDPDGTVHYGGAATIISRAKGEYTILKRQGTPKVNIKGTEDYDPTKPEGALLYKTTDKLHYAESSYDKATDTVTLRTTSGKKITYKRSDADARERYAPVIQKTDPDTGDVVFTNKAGDISYRSKARTQKSTKMAETEDAYTLVSEARHPMEIIYADYANSMKALANQARKEMVNTGNLEYSRTAKDTYREEVSSLNAKLNEALKNSPREREAQRRANAEVQSKKAAGEIESKSEIKKASQQAITKYRAEVSSVSRRDRSIIITDREWEAIQAGAISNDKLKKILSNADIDTLRQRATPRATTTLSPAKINKIKAMHASNHSLDAIARACGVSTSTVSNYLKGAN